VSPSSERRFGRAEPLPGRPQLFATGADEPRARRAGDAIQLGLAAIALTAISLAAIPAPALAQAVGRVFAAFPDFLEGLWQALSDALGLLAIVLVAATLVRRRWTLGRDLLLGATVAVVVWLFVARVVEGSWPAVWDAARAASPPAWYPAPRVAWAGAVVLTASPHLSLPARRVGAWTLALGAIAIVALGAAAPLGAVAGWLVALIAAAAVHLALGSTAGRPGVDMVRSALAELGVETVELGAADRQRAGVYVLRGTAPNGDHLVVKVYGRDAHDTAITATLWRRVWYREAGAPLRLGRLQQVEHEAFLTLFARQAGLVTDRVVTAGATASDDALLVLRRDGRVLTELSAAEREELDVADAIWGVVERLQDAGVAHGQVDDAHLLVLDGRLGLANFRGAAVAATPAQRRTDEVQALATAAALAGPERAVAAAGRALGTAELTAVLPYVQPPTLTDRQRQWVADGTLDLDELRARASAAAGTDAPALVQLRRVTVGSIVSVVLPAIAVIALLSGLAGLDLNEFGDQLRDATWWLVAAGVVVSQLPRITQAVSTLGASPVPLPLGPVYALQLAVSYVNLAIPTAAARVGVNIRFFQRHGVPPGSAIAAGAIDGFGGFVAQALILASLLIFTPASLDLELDRAADGARTLLIVAVVIGVVAVGLVAAVARWRRFVVAWAKRLGVEAWEAVRGLRSPRRLLLLFVGNLASELLFALALAVFARALGFPVGLATALLVNITVALLAGLVPVPGGIGVAEGGLTFGLVQAGVPEGAALAAVLLYRLSTFYLPPIWGFFALRWLERREHL
jgi:uncharacterized membrane protein YbhN (UPF0104 family)